MEKNSEFLGDDCIYPSNFEEELFDVVSVEKLLQTPQESNNFASCSTMQETYFTSLTLKQRLTMMKSKEENVKKEEKIQASLI